MCPTGVVLLQRNVLHTQAVAPFVILVFIPETKEVVQRSGAAWFTSAAPHGEPTGLNLSLYTIARVVFSLQTSECAGALAQSVSVQILNFSSVPFSALEGRLIRVSSSQFSWEPLNRFLGTHKHVFGNQKTDFSPAVCFWNRSFKHSIPLKEKLKNPTKTCSVLASEPGRV